jgi:hypothetical protein
VRRSSELTGHRISHLLHHPAHVFLGLPFEGDLLAHDHPNGPFPDPQASFGNNLSAARDGDGNDVTARPQGQMEPPRFEGLQGSILASCSLWKNEHGGSIPNSLCRLVHAFQGFSRVISLNSNISGSPHGVPENRNPHKFLFDDELEIHWKSRQEGENIKIAGVVRHVDVWLIFYNIFNPFHVGLDAAYLENHLGPRYGTVKVNKPGAAAEECEKYTVSSKKDGVNSNKGIEKNETEHIFKLSYFLEISLDILMFAKYIQFHIIYF